MAIQPLSVEAHQSAQAEVPAGVNDTYRTDSLILYLPLVFDLAAFDFNGDGILEIVTSARAGWVGGLSILDGTSGVHLHEIILRRSAPDPTICVADIDGDHHAEVWVKIRDPHWATTGSVIGLENAAADWMPTRPIWNQEAYHVTNVLADGTIPASEAVHWLQPGLNLAHVNALLLGEAATDSFTYEVSDGELASNEATVFVEMPENRPPRILSTPRQSSAPASPTTTRCRPTTRTQGRC